MWHLVGFGDYANYHRGFASSPTLKGNLPLVKLLCSLHNGKVKIGEKKVLMAGIGHVLNAEMPEKATSPV
jgi:hypothetical protein